MCKEYLNHFNLAVGNDLKKFVEDVFKNDEYLFIRNELEREYMTSTPIKVKYGYCSHCRNEFKIESGISHNDNVICGVCGAKLEAKEVRYGKKKLMNEACLYWFEKSIKDPKVITCKGYYVSKEYDKDYKNPEYEYNLQALYIFDTNTKKSKMFTKNYWGKDAWKERVSIFDFNQGWLINKWCHCSFESLDIAVKGTVFQYSNYKKYCGIRSIVTYLERFNKYQWVEQLDKIGFHKIVESFIWKEGTYSCLNYRGKDIFKKLRLNKNDVKEMRESKVEITTILLRLYQLNKKHDYNTDIYIIKEFHEKYGLSDYSAETTILELTSANKAIKYINKQYEKFNKKCYSFKSNVLTMWKDYIEDCRKLCRDLKNKDILFPKNLYKSHQDTNNLIKVEGDKRLDKKILTRLEKLKEIYCFEDKKFFIRPAESSQDLIKEGDRLNHCVARNYTQPYANGRCDILFLRRIDNPNAPLVTIEVRDGRIIQAYGKRNTRPKSEEENFIKDFKDKILEKVNNKKGKVA